MLVFKHSNGKEMRTFLFLAKPTKLPPPPPVLIEPQTHSKVLFYFIFSN